MRTVIIISVLLFCIVQYALWFSPSGVISLWHLKSAIADVNAQNTELAQRNAVLQADVQDLKRGNEAVEERARNDLGMIKNGETFYQVVK